MLLDTVTRDEATAMHLFAVGFSFELLLPELHRGNLNSENQNGERNGT